MKARRTRKGAAWLLVLFVIPFIVLLWPPFYNFIDPQVMGVPFFYWSQLAWVLVTAAITLIVYLGGPREWRKERDST